jgi:4-hydroxybenzoate polyprenyltransferase
MNQVKSPSQWEVGLAYLRLPHAVPVLMVMATTATLGLLVSGGWPGTGPALRLLGAMLSSQVAIGAINDLVDAELDAGARSDKPIPSGLVSPSAAQAIAAAGIVLMAVLSATFGVDSFLLCALGTALGIAYSLWFKRTIWAWVPYLLALPLLPIWVWTALGDLDWRIVAVYPVALPAVIGLQVAQSLPDVESDRRARVDTLAVRLGVEPARNACWSSTVLAVALAVASAPWVTNRPAFLWIAAGPALALVLINGLIWARDRAQGIRSCFPCVALSVALLAIGWAAAIVYG